MAKRPTIAPILKILPLVVAGILVGEWLDIEAWQSAVAAAVCIACAVVWRRKRVANAYMALAVVLVAMTSTTLRQTPTDLTYDKPITTTATITSVPVEQGRWRVCDATIVSGGQKYKVSLRTDTALVAPILGQRGELNTMVRELPEGGYGRLMSRRGYSAFCYTYGQGDWTPTEQTTSPAIWAKRCQQRLAGRIDLLGLSNDQASVVKAMAIGWRSQMDRELKEAYSQSGCAHLLAISGLHVGIVAMLVWALLWFMPIVGRKGHVWHSWLTMGAMVIYAVVAGMSPSVMRATFMFCSAQIGLSMGGTRLSAAALCTALSLMLLIRPNNLFDISFQLSAMAVMGIMAVYKTLRSKLMTSCVPLNSMVATILIGLCSMCATLPLVAHTFGIVGVAGVASNPVVILTANILVLGTLCWSLLPIEPLRGIASWVIGNVAQIQNKFVEATSATERLKIEVTTSSDTAVAGCYALMAGGIAWWHIGKDRTKWIALNFAY